MHKYLDQLENKIENMKLRGFLFNRYYNIRDLYWAVLYTAAFGLLAGIGNALPELQSGLADILYAFAQGFLNNTYLSIFISIVFAKIINLLNKSKNIRIYGNLVAFFTQLLFLAWHYFIGTQNPIAAISLQAILAFILTNYQITAVKNSKI
ncbi:hypothetical protein HYU09_00605 [Candidatus Woesearchaeota archaeon]|nr:hypothetical protein [Candidatus Woesearchaeota archaeon]